jgi:hypothetical protein
MADDEPPDPASYRVGYGKPPRQHRFKKGRSGNPRGRPRKSKSPKREQSRLVGSDEPTRQMILEEAYRTVRVREGDQVVEMPTNRAVFRAMSMAAIKGNRVAQRDWTAIVQRVEGEQRQTQLEWFQAMVEYKRDAEAEIARCAALGVEPPEMIPHPDDIHIDPNTGIAQVHGPFTPEQKRHLDDRIARRAEAQSEVSQYAADRRSESDPRMKAILLDHQHHEQRIFDIINDQLPERYQTKLTNRSYEKGASMPGDGLRRVLKCERAIKKG